MKKHLTIGTRLQKQNKTQQHSNVLYQLLLLQSRPTYLGAAGIAECVV